MKALQKGDKKLLNAWAFYDWANSVYSLVIASAIFPIYYSAIFAFFPERVFSRRMIKIFGAEFQRQMVQLGDNIIKQHSIV